MADILVIDDEENITYSIQLALGRAGHECRVGQTAAEGLERFRAKPPDLAVVDIQLPDGSGLDLIEQFHQSQPELPVIVITAFGSVSRAVEAMKRGAADFIQKPLSVEEVVLAVERCRENRAIRDRLDAYQRAQRRISDTVQLVGQCPSMLEVLALADRIATLPDDLHAGLTATLILGETGTGKEVLARYVHHRSPRADRPFVHVNCTAIPESLFESELMGHERGTFTDAKEAKKGLLEIAHEGTIFLDEVGDMPLTTQSKLLVVIESGRFRRLGGTRERAVDVRVLAATNTDLDGKVRRGEFRTDLYYRLKTFDITLPPLRARGEDRLLLAEYFVDLYGRKLHKPVPTLPPETRAVIESYGWPGNVRELAHTLQRAVLLNDSDALTPASLGLSPGASRGAPAEDGALRFDFSSGRCTLAQVEKQLIAAALETVDGNISAAARILGLTRGGLRHRMERHDLTPRGE